MNNAFYKIASQISDPRRVTSGTENMAPLLYSLVRMTRPQRILELGIGYSTLFSLQAMADNVKDIGREKEALLAKSSFLAGRKTLDLRSAKARPIIDKWRAMPGMASCVDPRYYSQDYTPRLISLDILKHQHPYIKRLRKGIKMLGHDALFQFVSYDKFSAELLPSGFVPIDFVFHDNHEKGFFEKLWPFINPNGGILVVHGVPCSNEFWEETDAIRATEKNLELFILEEPHKYEQNGCAVFRKTNVICHHINAYRLRRCATH